MTHHIPLTSHPAQYAPAFRHSLMTTPRWLKLSQIENSHLHIPSSVYITEPGKYSLSDYPVSKKLIHLLRHGSLPRDNDGAIEFWRIKDNLQNHFMFCHHWSDEKWKACMAGGGRNKKRYQYCTDSPGAILYIRALEGHSGRSLIDPTLQDNVIIPNGFFQ